MRKTMSTTSELATALDKLTIGKRSRWRVTPAGHGLIDVTLWTDDNCTLLHELSGYCDEEPHTRNKFVEIFDEYARVLVSDDERHFVEVTRDNVDRWLDDMTQRGLLQRVQ